MKAKMKIPIVISIVVCFSFGCASTSKKTWPKCVHCGAIISTKEGSETITEEEGQHFSIMGVGSGTGKTLSESKALTVDTIVGQGTAWATIGDKTFDDLIWEFGAVLRTINGYTVGRSYYKFTTPNGQYFLLEGNGDVLQSGAWDILYGTGKWGGITGKAKGKLIIHGRPFSTETEQYRFRLDGKLKSPKWE